MLSGSTEEPDSTDGANQAINIRSSGVRLMLQPDTLSPHPRSLRSLTPSKGGKRALTDPSRRSGCAFQPDARKPLYVDGLICYHSCCQVQLKNLTTRMVIKPNHQHKLTRVQGCAGVGSLRNDPPLNQCCPGSTEEPHEDVAINIVLSPHPHPRSLRSLTPSKRGKKGRSRT